MYCKSYSCNSFESCNKIFFFRSSSRNPFRSCSVSFPEVFFRIFQLALSEISTISFTVNSGKLLREIFPKFLWECLRNFVWEFFWKYFQNSSRRSTEVSLDFFSYCSSGNSSRNTSGNLLEIWFEGFSCKCWENPMGNVLNVTEISQKNLPGVCAIIFFQNSLQIFKSLRVSLQKILQDFLWKHSEKFFRKFLLEVLSTPHREIFCKFQGEFFRKFLLEFFQLFRREIYQKFSGNWKNLPICLSKFAQDFPPISGSGNSSTRPSWNDSETSCTIVWRWNSFQEKPFKRFSKKLFRHFLCKKKSLGLFKLHWELFKKFIQGFFQVLLRDFFQKLLWNSFRRLIVDSSGNRSASSTGIFLQKLQRGFFQGFPCELWLKLCWKLLQKFHRYIFHRNLFQ